jgi:hypothetical protein
MLVDVVDAVDLSPYERQVVDTRQFRARKAGRTAKRKEGAALRRRGEQRVSPGEAKKE